MLLKSYEKVFDYLFEPDEEVLDKKLLSPAQLSIKQRCLAIYTRKLANPMASDITIARQLCKQFDVSIRAIYNDIKAVETLICAIKKANKEYIRYMVTETQKFAIKKEKLLILKGKDSTKDLSYAVKVLSDAHGLHDTDPDMPDWSSVQPQAIDIVDDLTVMDITDDIGEERAQQLKRKYLPKFKGDMSDAEVIE